MEKPPAYLGALGDNGDTRDTGDGRSVTKHVNQFYFPTSSSEEARAFLQVADVKLPDGEYQGIRPMMYRYQQAIGVLNSPAHAVSVNLAKFSTDSFILAFDTEKSPGMHNTGLSTMHGSIVLVLQNFGAGTEIPTRYHIVTYLDNVCSVGNFGCEVAF